MVNIYKTAYKVDSILKYIKLEYFGITKCQQFDLFSKYSLLHFAYLRAFFLIPHSNKCNLLKKSDMWFLQIKECIKWTFSEINKLIYFDFKEGFSTS